MKKKKEKDDSNKYLLPGSIFIAAIFIFIVFLISNTYALDDVGNIHLNCNKTIVSQGDEITCNVTGSVISSKEVTAITAKVNLSSNLEFVSFTKGSIWQGGGESGYISLYGGIDIPSTFDVGTLVVRAKKSIYNTKESIEINDVKYVDGPANDFAFIDIPTEKIELNTPSFTSTTYNLSNNYILTNTKNISSIISNITSSNCDVKVSNDNTLVTTGTITTGSKLVIKYNNNTLKEYDIIYLESSKHDLTKNYLFTDKNNLTQVLSEFSTIGGTLSIKNGRVALSYNNSDIKYYDIIQLYTDKFTLDIENNYLLTNDTSNVIANINKSNNVTLSINGENLQVNYNNEVVKVIKIYTISSTIYDIEIEKGYIYTKQPATLANIKSNVQTNSILSLSNNKLSISDTKGELKTLDIINLSTNNYIINYNNKYIYTGATTDAATIKNNITVLNSTKSINNNKLIIQHNNVIVDEYNIYNISSTHNIKNNNIYIKQAETYQTFLNKITLNGVIAKVFNESNNEITSGTINNNYVLKIYANNNELASYTINIEYYELDNNLNVKEENNEKTIYKLDLNTPYTQLLNKISTSGTIEIKDKKNNTVTTTSNIKTGDIVTIKLGSGDVSYKISVLGDVFADGVVDIRDINILYRYVLHSEQYPLTREFVLAGDVFNGDGIAEGRDVNRLYRYYRNVLTGKEDSLE